MLQRFRKANISTKLSLSALSFILPVIVLMLLMDLSFRYDINIGKTELQGIRHLRQTVPLMHSAARYRTYQAYQMAGLETPPNSLEQAKQEAESILKSISAQHQTFVDAVNDAPRGVAAVLAAKPTPQDLIEEWRRAQSTANIEGTDLLDETLLFIQGISDCSLLTADPVLDSAHLAKAVVHAMPESMLHLYQIQTIIQRSQTGMQQAGDMNRLMTASALLKNSDLKTIVNTSQTAMDLDPHFYGRSPGLHNGYDKILKEFLTQTNSLVSQLQTANSNTKQLKGLSRQVEKTAQTLHTLFEKGLNELEKLVELRIASYQRWRAAAYAFSITIAFIAALLIAHSYQNITKAIEHVRNYASRVSGGDYNTQVNPVLPGEIKALSGNISGMVQTLKHQLGYTRGLLHGLTIPCIVLDTEENLTFLNQPYLDLFEREGTPEDYVGINLAEFYYKDHHHETITGRAIKENRAFREDEIEVTTPSNKKIFVRFDVAPIHDLDNNIIGAYAIITDLTKIKRQQQKIVELAAFAEANPSPVFAAAPDGSVIYRNKSAQSAMEQLGLSEPHDFLPPKHAELLKACCSKGVTREVFETSIGDRTYSWIYHPLPDGSRIHIYALDISALKRAERQLLHNAYHDRLTGLPNKPKFIEHITQSVGECTDKTEPFAVLLMDVDNFKHVNDSLGHRFGDKLITEIASRLQQQLTPGDVLARLGGDEFALLLHNVNTPQAALDMAKRVHKTISRPIRIDSSKLFTSVGIGLAMGDKDCTSGDDLIRDADTAMYRAKTQGPGGTVIFDTAMHIEAAKRLELETDMKHGVQRQEFEPYYQPIIDLKTGRINGFEALVRWHHPQRGLVPPGQFIPLAEETGIVASIGTQVLNQAMEQAQHWCETIPGHANLTMSVNVAEPQLKQGRIVDTVRESLRQTSFPPSQLKLEITESGAMNDIATAIEVQDGLKQLGATLSIDDFGTGYSSLAHLTRFPFDILKVDQSFVFAMLNNNNSMEIVRTIVSLAHGLGKKVIAEGVETPEALAVLRGLGVEFGQGYFFAKPLTATDATDLLQKNPTW